MSHISTLCHIYLTIKKIEFIEKYNWKIAKFPSGNVIFFQNQEKRPKINNNRLTSEFEFLKISYSNQTGK